MPYVCFIVIPGFNYLYFLLICFESNFEITNFDKIKLIKVGSDFVLLIEKNDRKIKKI